MPDSNSSSSSRCDTNLNKFPKNSMSQFADSAVSGRVHFGHSLVEGGVDLVSVSSVGAESDRGGREDSLAICDEATPLYVRLKELDQLTSTFLMPRYNLG